MSSGFDLWRAVTAARRSVDHAAPKASAGDAQSAAAAAFRGPCGLARRPGPGGGGGAGGMGTGSWSDGMDGPGGSGTSGGCGIDGTGIVGAHGSVGFDGVIGSGCAEWL